MDLSTNDMYSFIIIITICIIRCTCTIWITLNIIFSCINDIFI